MTMKGQPEIGIRTSIPLECRPHGKRLPLFPARGRGMVSPATSRRMARKNYRTTKGVVPRVVVLILLIHTLHRTFPNLQVFFRDFSSTCYRWEPPEGNQQRFSSPGLCSLLVNRQFRSKLTAVHCRAHRSHGWRGANNLNATSLLLTQVISVV